MFWRVIRLVEMFLLKTSVNLVFLNVAAIL